MNKKEFYLIAIIVIYTYLSLIFQVNLRNYVALEKNQRNNITFNAFR